MSDSSRSARHTVAILCLGLASLGLLLTCCGGIIHFGARALEQALTALGESVAEGLRIAFADLNESSVVLNSFLKDIREDGLDAAYAATTDSFQTSMTSEEFSALIARYPAIKGDPKETRFLRPQWLATPETLQKQVREQLDWEQAGPDGLQGTGENPDSALKFDVLTIASLYEIDDKKSVELMIEVVKENGVWKINQFSVAEKDSSIQPPPNTRDPS